MKAGNGGGKGWVCLSSCTCESLRVAYLHELSGIIQASPQHGGWGSKDVHIERKDREWTTWKLYHT